MSELTDKLQVACRGFVREQLPHEAPLFDHIWTAFWSAMGCPGIEELEEAAALSEEVSPVSVLGAVNTGRQELDTLFVLGTIVNALVSIQSARPKGEVTSDIIADTLKQEFLRINTPDHLQPILFEHGVGLLAGLLGVERPDNSGRNVVLPGQLWVEYCDKLGRPHENPNVSTGWLTEEEVDSKFRGKRNKFQLFVDEFAPAIYLAKGNKAVSWMKLSARHKVLLGTILEALPKRYPITIEAIFDKKVSKDHALTFNAVTDGSRTRTDLSELNSFLNGVFKDVIKAERRMNQYGFVGRITYCWIRPSNHSSRLFP